MSDYIEYTPKRHGQRPPYWTPDTPTGLDNKNFVRQPNWAWIAGTVYYVPYEAVYGVPRPAPVEEGVDVGPVDPLVEVLAECGVDPFESWADQLREALAKRGLKIVEDV